MIRRPPRSTQSRSSTASDVYKRQDDALLEHAKMQSDQSFGRNIEIYSAQNGFPDLANKKIAIVGVEEGRAAVGNHESGSNLNEIRKELYKLFPGNWPISVADIGNIPQGNSIEDTYFALGELLSYLIKNRIIPIVLGGGQDLTYSNYRAYDKLEQTVNIVSVDNKFDLGAIEDELNSQSYLSKIVMNPPNNLFNFSNIGYQTYLNSQNEIDLLDGLFFEAYRLGEVSSAIQLVE